jgi:hypothetical protein
MTTPWEIPRDWDGETVAVLASGPSMCMEVAETVRGRCRVIAVNNQAIPTQHAVTGVVLPALAPWADMLYAADAKWWMHHQVAALAFPGQKVTVRNVVPFPEVLSLQLSVAVPYDPRPAYVVPGGNSGYQAAHIAAQRGARRILLCGFDMRAVNGAKHWFGDHPGNLNSPQRYTTWVGNFGNLAKALAARKVELINCTPKGALTGMPRMSVAEALGNA